MKPDEILQKNVQATIKWQPLLNTSLIEVNANNGLITLKGGVDIYAKKLEAERVTKTVKNVKAVINEIEVNFEQCLNISDKEIREEMLNDMKWRQIPIDNIKIAVKEGWVTLEGRLHWNYQREIAKNAGNYINGVKGVTSNIALEVNTHDQIEENVIKMAIVRNPIVNSKDICIEVSADRVILTGKVDSLYQKEEVERTVWKASGVWNLDNQLEVTSVEK